MFSFFFFPPLKGKEDVEVRRRETDKDKGGIVLPKVIVAGCWRKVRGSLQKRGDEGKSLRKGGGRKESEQQYDWRFVVSLIVYFTEVSFSLQMSGFRTSWGPRPMLVLGPRLSRMWGNPLHCSCQEPGTNRYKRV